MSHSASPLTCHESLSSSVDGPTVEPGNESADSDSYEVDQASESGDSDSSNPSLESAKGSSMLKSMPCDSIEPDDLEYCTEECCCSCALPAPATVDEGLLSWQSQPAGCGGELESSESDEFDEDQDAEPDHSEAMSSVTSKGSWSRWDCCPPGGTV